MTSNHPWSLQTYFHNEVGKLTRCCLWAQDARILGRHTLEEPNPTSKNLFLLDTAGKISMLLSGFCVGRVALSILVTAEQVLRSDGEERFKWMCAGRKELDNLTGTGTVECISPQVGERIKAEARA